MFANNETHAVRCSLLNPIRCNHNPLLRTLMRLVFCRVSLQIQKEAPLLKHTFDCDQMVSGAINSMEERISKRDNHYQQHLASRSVLMRRSLRILYKAANFISKPTIQDSVQFEFGNFSSPKSLSDWVSVDQKRADAFPLRVWSSLNEPLIWQQILLDRQRAILSVCAAEMERLSSLSQTITSPACPRGSAL